MKILFRKNVFPGRFIKGKHSPLRVRKHPYGTSCMRVETDYDEDFDIDEDDFDISTMTVSDIEALNDENNKIIEEIKNMLS